MKTLEPCNAAEKVFLVEKILDLQRQLLADGFTEEQCQLMLSRPTKCTNREIAVVNDQIDMVVSAASSDDQKRKNDLLNAFYLIHFGTCSDHRDYGSTFGKIISNKITEVCKFYPNEAFHFRQQECIDDAVSLILTWISTGFRDGFDLSPDRRLSKKKYVSYIQNALGYRFQTSIGEGSESKSYYAFTRKDVCENVYRIRVVYEMDSATGRQHFHFCKELSFDMRNAEGHSIEDVVPTELSTEEIVVAREEREKNYRTVKVYARCIADVIRLQMITKNIKRCTWKQFESYCIDSNCYEKDPQLAKRCKSLLKDFGKNRRSTMLRSATIHEIIKRLSESMRDDEMTEFLKFLRKCESYSGKDKNQTMRGEFINLIREAVRINATGKIDI